MESSTLFRSNSKLAWGFYGHRINLYKNTEPNSGFTLLKELVASKNSNYFIFTSNVDTHFQKAGFDREKIYEIHGSIEYLQCVSNCTKSVTKNNLNNLDINMEKLELENIPKCDSCGAVMMPNILMFGDGIFNESIVSAQNNNFQKWLKLIKDLRVVIFEIGVGTTIPTVRNFNDRYAQKHDNALLIRINPLEYEVINDKDVGIKGKGLEVLKKLLL